MAHRQHSVRYYDAKRITVRTMICEGDKVVHYADRVINMTYDEFKSCYEKWNNGEMIQNAFPTLSAEDREHLLSGKSLDSFFNTAEA